MFRRFIGESKPEKRPAGHESSVPENVPTADVVTPLFPSKSATPPSGGVDWTSLKVRFHQRLLDILNVTVLDKVPRPPRSTAPG